MSSVQLDTRPKPHPKKKLDHPKKSLNTLNNNLSPLKIKFYLSKKLQEILCSQHFPNTFVTNPK